MKTLQLQYFKVNCRFRSQEFKCIIGCTDEKEITGDAVATIISKQFKATIPAAEISFGKTKTSLL